MTNALLSLVLVLTQTLSLSASPLYLCVDSDGSVCIDFGPENCDCCQHSPAELDTCGVSHSVCNDRDRNHHDHGQSHGQRPDADRAKIASVSDPCDCVHIQIFQPLGSALVSSAASPNAERLSVFFTTMAGDLVADGSRPTDSATRPSTRLCTGSLPPSEVAPVVLRC